MLNALIKHTIKLYLRAGFFLYYKKIIISGQENIADNKPVFLLPNHQNALIDALLIATHVNGFANYLTRANVFKHPFLEKLLRFFGLVPIYRMRDGYSSLEKNREIFDYCISLFSNNEKLLAFPEANHNIQRRVRKLSKGFTRIVFQELAENPDTALELIPVGLNYLRAERCPDSVRIIFGEPIHAQKYKSENEKEITEHLRRSVQEAIALLTTDIPEETYLEASEKLDSAGVNFLEPDAVNKYLQADFQNYTGKPATSGNPLRKVFKILLIINLIIPYLYWKWYVKPKIREAEFVSTFRFTVAVTVVPIYLIIVCGILYATLGFNTAASYLAIVLILDLLAIKL